MTTLVILSTGSAITHAAVLAGLTPGDHGGQALCGAWGFADHIGREPLRVTGAGDLNVNCLRCRSTKSWKEATG